MENEIWKDIDGYIGLYQISNLGRVKSLYREYYSGKNHKILKIKKESIIKNKIYKATGYYYIVLCKDSTAKKVKIHRLVCAAFHDNPQNKAEVDHKNTIRSDNRAENLKWVTRKENQNNPITKQKHSISKIGKLNPMKNKRICFGQYDLNNNFIENHYGVKETAKKLGFQDSSISKCLTGVYQTAHGFKWYYL